MVAADNTCNGVNVFFTRGLFVQRTGSAVVAGDNTCNGGKRAGLAVVAGDNTCNGGEHYLTRNNINLSDEAVMLELFPINEIILLQNSTSLIIFRRL